MADPGPLRILNVDDDEAKRYSITRLLRRAGFEVQEATTGQEALDQASGEFDLIVLDVNLPDIHGVEVCRRLKTDPATAAVPVLHLSATAIEVSDRVAGLESGADAYLAEPVAAPELLATVRALLRTRKAEEEARELLEREHAANERLRQALVELEAANSRLAASNEELEARRAEQQRLNEQLSGLYERLREEERRKDEFLAMLGHELRNPLGSLRNALHLLDQAGSREEDRRRLRATAQRSAGALVRLVDDLLDLSRISRGRIDLRPERLDLREVVDDAIRTTRDAVEARGNELKVELPEEPVWVEADAVRLSQVLVNLLGNAAKFTGPDGTVTVTLSRDGGDARVCVRDTGVGIAREVLPRIFDLFAQGSTTLDRSAGGLGIGLTLVRNLVELHRGRVVARSEGPGRGAEFEVWIPTAAPPEEVALPWPGLSDGQAQAGLRVLVVDDDVDGGDTLGEIIDAWGHQVRVTRDGPSALEVSRAYHPQVILCDIGLPGKDGYEVARELRASPEMGPLFLIAISGYGQEADVRRGLDAGFDRYITKPLQLDALQQLLRDAGTRP